MAEVVKFPGTTVLPMSVRSVLDAAPDDLGIALVVGKAADDTLYLAGTTSDLAEVMLLLERAKAFTLKMVEDNSGQRFV